MLRAHQDNNNSKERSPRDPIHSTKVPETTLTDASETCERTEGLKINDLRSSLMKTCVAERTCQPTQLAYDGQSCETQGQVTARLYMRQSPSIGSCRAEGRR